MSVVGILGKKIGMTQLFDDRGDIHPVTVLKAGPCVVTQLKTLAKDGYEAAQIGYVDFVKASKVNKAMTGHFAKSNVPPVRMIKVQGSIGASSFPSRVFPGQRMPGHMGHAQITVRNLRIRGIDLDDNLIMVEGAVPGPRDGYVLISKAKAPPRERRGFAGAATKDALKASKKAAPSKKK